MEIHQKAAAVGRAFSELAEVTVPPGVVQFEGGDYARLYVRPKSKLGSALLTTREILVLVTNFARLQARAIKMVERCLTQAQGRLEPGMAVVFHEDPNGDENLRSWGRERGLTILPVYCRGPVPSGDALDTSLRSSLYTHDPFDVSGPVRQAHQFFGRAEIPDSARRLRGGSIQSLFGIRRIGKTSVLNRTIDEARQFHEIACVMADCSDDSISALDAGQQLHSIAGGINDALTVEATHYTSLMPTTETITPAEAGRVLLTVLREAQQPVSLFFDEIDYITPSSPTADHWLNDFNPFFRALRQVYQECCRREIGFSVVMCGVSSRWFTAERIEGVENAALSFAPETYLPPLERKHSREMVEALGRSAGLIFSPSASEEVALTCADAPFWIRRAGSYLHSCFPADERPIRLDKKDVAPLCQEFIEVEGGPLAFSSLRHLFRIYPELGPVAIDCLHGRHLERHPQPLLSALGRYGILGEGFAPSGPMMEQGLALWESDTEAASPSLPFVTAPQAAIEPGSASAAGDEEWADLLSEVSHRRNSLERDLREFVLAVLRIECAQRDDDKKPIDLVIAAVAPDRRQEINRLNTGAAMRALYWQELVGVIRKQWRLFEAHFGDRRQLDLFADIINDRPDAHAKEFDGAELALQRRAIGWFEDRLAQTDLL